MESQAPNEHTLPDRIWVLGPTGAGKSTVTARLAAHMGVEPTHIDDIHWQPDWTESPRGRTTARVAEIAQRPRWIMDGNYSFVRTPLEHRIQFYVWLDLPLRVTFPRLVRRGIHRSLTQAPCCNGNRETLRRTFLDRDSLLLFALSHFRVTRRNALASVEERTHVRLRSQRAVDRWLAGVLAGQPPVR